MEIKKSPSADLEKGKGLSLLLGLLVALSIVFVSLEWRSSTAQANTNDQKNAQDLLEDVMVVQDKEPEKPKEPEPEQAPQQPELRLPDEFKVAPNDKVVEKPTFISSDENKETPPANATFNTVKIEGNPNANAGAGEDLDTQVFDVVEENPEYPGGVQALMKFLAENIRYPESAQDQGIQGRVLVRFVVETDGHVSAPEVMKGVDPALDKEAIRVVKLIKNWKPGRQQGKAVRVRFVLPISFTLQ